MAANFRPPPPLIDLEDDEEVHIFRPPPILIDLEEDKAPDSPEFVGIDLDDVWINNP